uniref:Uncharacterized protein n=1 Tax=Cacopsylla melanoneura TaxID=428564 RepID=A0A8D8MHV3_9HEMI
MPNIIVVSSGFIEIFDFSIISSIVLESSSESLVICSVFALFLAGLLVDGDSWIVIEPFFLFCLLGVLNVFSSPDMSSFDCSVWSSSPSLPIESVLESGRRCMAGGGAGTSSFTTTTCCCCCNLSCCEAWFGHAF